MSEVTAYENEAQISDSDLDAVLTELKVGADEEDLEEVEQAVSEVEAAEARQEAYEEQGVEPDPDPADVAAAMQPKSKRASTKGMKPSEQIAAKLNPGDVIDGLVIDQDFLDAVDAEPKKVAEKIVNAIHSINNGVNISVYTQIAAKFLKEHGSVTLTELRNHYTSGGKRPYSLGTAGAQSSQMMRVLPMLNVATRNGSILTWVENSPVGEFLIAKENVSGKDAD